MKVAGPENRLCSKSAPLRTALLKLVCFPKLQRRNRAGCSNMDSRKEAPWRNSQSSNRTRPENATPSSAKPPRNCTPRNRILPLMVSAAAKTRPRTRALSKRTESPAAAETRASVTAAPRSIPGRPSTAAGAARVPARPRKAHNTMGRRVVILPFAVRSQEA